MNTYENLINSYSIYAIKKLPIKKQVKRCSSFAHICFLQHICKGFLSPSKILLFPFAFLLSPFALKFPLHIPLIYHCFCAPVGAQTMPFGCCSSHVCSFLTRSSPIAPNPNGNRHIFVGAMPLLHIFCSPACRSGYSVSRFFQKPPSPLPLPI